MSGILARSKALRKWFLPNYCHGPERRGLLVGIDAAGKTTLLYRWKLGEVITTISTMGFNVETIPRNNGSDLVLWDVGGSEKLRPLLRHYLPSTEYILFIHNCADKERFDEQIDEFHRVAKGLAEGGGRYIFVILNKQDLLPPAQRRHHVADIMRRYEQESTKHADKLTIDVLDLPYLSATKSSDAELHVILDHVQECLRRGPKPRAAIPTWNESRPAAKRPRADLDDLKRQARQMIDADGASADEFWQSLERGDVQEWNHYSHLRAGFFALVEGATSSMTLLDCADVLISKVKYLETLKPDHSFHDATHRTKTIFWLLQLHLSANKYVQEVQLGRDLTRDDFTNVLLHNPELSDSGLWRDYFSKRRISSPDASERWLFPDFWPLPSVYTMPFATEPPAVVDEAFLESYRLMSLGLAVAREMHVSAAGLNLGPDVVQQHALNGIETVIMRRRATDPNIPPFTPTKAWFWLQYVRGCLTGAIMKTGIRAVKAVAMWHGLHTEMTPEEFVDIFGFRGDEWQEYYSRFVWESMHARVGVVIPDLKPLPEVLAATLGVHIVLAPKPADDGSAQQPKADGSAQKAALKRPTQKPLVSGATQKPVMVRRVQKPTVKGSAPKPTTFNGTAQKTTVNTIAKNQPSSHTDDSFEDFVTVDIHGDAVETPSEDDLALAAAVIIDEAEIIALEDTEGSFVKGNSHARMLLRLHRILAEADDQARGWPAQAIADALEVPCAGAVDGRTQRTFWARQVLGARMNDGRRSESFEGFVLANKELANEELWRAYYSPAVWEGEQSKRMFVEPDCRTGADQTPWT
ncbi:ubiquitinyl hydrolase 1 [Purpureocillium lilacinum]|uniref:ARF-like GTPase ARLP2, atypical n=1 Tax=Purpureocillium lilacinum TaxID=33203 RepID=A0ABR0BVQ5_PURLI|nr:hypothetical protein Purlil1_7361 [Purpureocillium lilacinum]GJN79211.1 ubiquitinyl hydrolase 1 [Purpureocillium lilacinum]